jgi:hypothetical protein
MLSKFVGKPGSHHIVHVLFAAHSAWSSEPGLGVLALLFGGEAL